MNSNNPFREDVIASTHSQSPTGTNAPSSVPPVPSRPAPNDTISAGEDHSTTDNDEEPPPYSLMPEEGSETLIPAAGPLILSRPPETPSSSSQSQSQFSASSGTLDRPPGRPSGTPSGRPSGRPPSHGYPGNHRPTFNGQDASAHSVAPPRPIHQGLPPPQPPVQSSVYHRPPPPATPPRPPASIPPGAPVPPFNYPRGYWCPKCHNTGIKLKNGLTCQDCYARFARQSNVVHQLPVYHGFQSPIPPRVVRPGDPSIGGILCGRCRGRGIVSDFLFDETCTTCRGIGRLL